MPARLRSGQIALAIALLASGGALFAQIDGGRGVAPLASAGVFEVSGVDVDVAAKSAQAARETGWRIAQRKAWSMLSQRSGHGAAILPDGELDSLVDAIVVENEQIGPTRYIARLGVTFDRDRAAPLLGLQGVYNRSAAMLVVPVMISGGAATAFEQRTPWQEAWARFRTGESAIDYVRPTGTGPDPLLLNAGQVERRGRGLWRNILDQYGASDVLIPTVTLYRQWPGGPVIGVFEARHGPDNVLLQRFTLRVGSGDALPALLDAGAKRMDDIYQAALGHGQLAVDAGLAWRPPVPTPSPTATATDSGSDEGGADEAITVAAPSAGATAGAPSALTVQFDSPSAGSVAAAEASLHGIAGVSSAETVSLAIGGVSVMRVGYAGDASALAAALQARGWQVSQAGGTLRIRRSRPEAAPSESPPGGG